MVFTLAGKKDFDARFHAMLSHPGLRHFKEGISKVKQWTGADHKQLQRVFVSSLVGTTPHHDVVKAGRALLNFIYVHRTVSVSNRRHHPWLTVSSQRLSCY